MRNFSVFVRMTADHISIFVFLSQLPRMQIVSIWRHTVYKNYFLGLSGSAAFLVSFLKTVQFLDKCIEDKICFDFRYNFFLFLLSTR